MPDLWVDVDTAVTVPVNILPLLDNTDFKTIEQDIAYDAAGMDLVWNFQTAAGVTSCTAVTPTTGGDYDWSETVANKGMYKIEIPAAAGASINNNTEGVGWFTGSATGVLPWRGPTIGFRRAALNDLLIDGGTASTNLEDFFDGTGYAGGTAKLDVNVATIANDAVTAAAIATDAIDDDALAANAVTAIQSGLATSVALNAVDNFVDTEITTIINTLGTPAGASLSADIAAIEAQTDDIGIAGAGLTAVPWNATWDAEVESEVNDALNTIIADSVAADGVRPTVRQALLMILRFLTEKSVAGLTVTVNKEDGTTAAMTFTLNDASNPTSITRAT